MDLNGKMKKFMETLFGKPRELPNWTFKDSNGDLHSFKKRNMRMLFLRRRKWWLLPLLFLSTSAEAINPRGYPGQRVEVTNEQLIIGTTEPIEVTTTNSTVTVKRNFIDLSFDITVIAGVGVTVFSSTGTTFQCSINAPSDIAVYEFNIFTNDAAKFAILGKAGLVGDTGLGASRVLLGSHTGEIAGATVDGTYQIRCVLLE